MSWWDAARWAEWLPPDAAVWRSIDQAEQAEKDAAEKAQQDAARAHLASFNDRMRQRRRDVDTRLADLRATTQALQQDIARRTPE